MTADRLGLTPILKHSFPEDYQTVLARAFYEISEATPLYLFPQWRECTGLEETPLLGSKDLGVFTQKVGSGILQRQQPVQDASGQGQIYYPHAHLSKAVLNAAV
jgi:hypothetical protein